jgi:hypothetical protein
MTSSLGSMFKAGQSAAAVERCMTSLLGSRFKAGQSAAAVGKVYDVITWIQV